MKYRVIYNKSQHYHTPSLTLSILYHTLYPILYILYLYSVILYPRLLNNLAIFYLKSLEKIKAMLGYLPVL